MTITAQSARIQIRRIDRSVRAIHLNMRSLEAIDLSSAASWQAAWDKHPELYAEEQALYLQRGELQRQLGEAIAEESRRAAQRTRKPATAECNCKKLRKSIAEMVNIFEGYAENFEKGSAGLLILRDAKRLLKTA